MPISHNEYLLLLPGFFERIISKTSAFTYLDCYLMSNKEVREDV
jgi:hypothetical protein